MTFQMLTGRLPFEGDSMTALMYQIANQPHPDVVAFNPQLPYCLRGFFDKALAKDPAQRYQTGAEFGQALRDCLGVPGGPA
jgi:serine/threonine-protein kinase